MLGSDSIVLRVGTHGELEALGNLPPLFFDRPIRTLLAGEHSADLRAACAGAIGHGRPTVFTSPDSDDELMIIPVLDDNSDACSHLVCWARSRRTTQTGSERNDVAATPWTGLRLADVAIRYRRRPLLGADVVDAAPWWALPEGGLLELWPNHEHVTAMGLGHAVMQVLITDAAEAAAEHGGGPAVRIVVPSPELLSGLVPLFHGVVRAVGLDPTRLIVGVDVALAVDPDLLPILVHLRTIGLRIDIVGLDDLTQTLHKICATTSSRLEPQGNGPGEADASEPGPWVASYEDTLNVAA